MIRPAGAGGRLHHGSRPEKPVPKPLSRDVTCPGRLNVPPSTQSQPSLLLAVAGKRGLTTFNTKLN
ncbi:hypothetical protein PtB15_11B449 [Puccinia triticina]|nr:hypothetical protein PtB15_11B449 [Puccinia triticina]